MTESTTPPESPVDAAVRKAVENTTLFYQVLMDLEAFDKQFIQGVLTAQFKLNERENCFLASYHRAVLNLRSMIALNNAQHFQAMAMLARNLFELAVAIRLIDTIPDSIGKMIAFQRLDRLKAAQKAVAFASTHTLEFPTDFSPYHQYMTAHQTAIEAEAMAIWGTLKVAHWSRKDLSQRAALLGKPFQEIYESLYKQLSWHVHAGITGIINMRPETFPHLFGISCQIAAQSYGEIIKTIMKEFRLSDAMPDLKNELEFAKLRAGRKLDMTRFTAGTDANLEARLRQHFGLT